MSLPFRDRCARLTMPPCFVLQCRRWFTLNSASYDTAARRSPVRQMTLLTQPFIKKSDMPTAPLSEVLNANRDLDMLIKRRAAMVQDWVDSLGAQGFEF